MNSLASMLQGNVVRAIASVVAITAVAAQCGGGRQRTASASADEQVCYRLTFGAWRSGDSTAFSLASLGLAHPLPDTIAVLGRLAARDTVFGKLRSTTGWSLMIRLVGSGATRPGSAWLAPTELADVSRPVPEAPITATTVGCRPGTLPLEIKSGSP